MWIYQLAGWLFFGMTALAVYRGQPQWAIFWLIAMIGADGVTWLNTFREIQLEIYSEVRND